LFVSGRIGDDEASPRRREIAISDVDRDALLALGGEAVDEKGIIDLRPLRAVAAGIGLQRLEVIVGDQLAVIEEAADQGRLAVVDAAAGDEAEEAQK
jgi:hypothetical protein